MPPPPPPVYCTASLAHPRRRRRNQLLPLRTHLSFSSSLNEPFSPFQIRYSGERGISLPSLGGAAVYNQDRQRHTAPSKREGGRTHFLPFLCDGDGSPRSPFSPLIPGYPKVMRRRRRKQAEVVAYFPSLHPPIAPRASQKKYRGKEELWGVPSSCPSTYASSPNRTGRRELLEAFWVPFQGLLHNVEESEAF